MDPKAWSAYDAGNVDGRYTRGYSGAVSHGPYIYFVPHDNLSFHGQFIRYDQEIGVAQKNNGMTCILVADMTRGSPLQIVQHGELH